MKTCIERSLRRAEHDGTRGVFVFSFAASEDTFNGHFPGHPILPGIFQLDMARFACERMADQPLDIAAISKAKFTRPILPAEEIVLSVKLERREGRLQAQTTVSANGEPAGTATLILTHRVTTQTA